MGKHKKRKLDADRTDFDDQDKASFFCSPKKKEKKKSKSMSDGELELSSTQAYDEVYQAQSNLSTAPPPNTSSNTSKCTITLLVGLNNDTERYSLIFNRIEYQSSFLQENSGFTRDLQLSKPSVDLRAGKRLSTETERKHILRLQILYIVIWP